jgi:carbon storage regulator CsrA
MAMLTLERKEGESLVLSMGDIQIEVTVAVANHGVSKLQIDAPREVTILRKELVDR